MEIALREFGDESNRAIAEMCGVSHQMVNDMRPSVGKVANTAATTTRTGTDGRQYKATKPGSRKLKASTPPPPAPACEGEGTEEEDVPHIQTATQELARRGPPPPPAEQAPAWQQVLDTAPNGKPTGKGGSRTLPCWAAHS